jgi:dTDP-glucose 4,6-dehydratase
MNRNKPAWAPTLDAEDLDHILTHTATLWDELHGQRLFITGGTGFFGHWLLESLLWINDILNLDVKLVLLSRNPAVFSVKYPQLANHPAISWIQGDVKSFDYPDGDYSFVIHAASEGDNKLVQENPLVIFNTIVTGTQHILEFAKTHHTKKLLFISSGAVYGKQPPELTHIPEDYPGAPDVMNPLSAYGEGKRAAEMLCTLYSHQYGFETKIARCFAFVGPYLPLDANYAIGNFIRDALHGGPIVIKGDGTPFRSYLYAADLAIWLWTILVKGQSRRPYNIGSDEPLTIEEVAQHVMEQFQHKVFILVLSPPNPAAVLERYIPGVNQAKTELGLDIWISLDTAIQKTIKYYQENL